MEYTYKYPRPALTADCVVFTKGDTPKVLLIKRKNEPYKGSWAFPGGFMNMDETLMQCAYRELKEETGIGEGILDIKEIGCYSKVDRDPRGRTITVAFLVLVEHETDVKGQDDAAEAKWFSFNQLPPLAFDHVDIFTDALVEYGKMREDFLFEENPDSLQKIDILSTALTNTLIAKKAALKEVSIPVLAFSIAKLFVSSALVSIESHENAEDLILNIYFESIEEAFKVLTYEKKIALNEKKIQELKNAVYQNLKEFEKAKSKVPKLIDNDDDDLN